MPLPSNIKPQLNRFVSASVGAAQALVITRVQGEVNRIIEELLNQCPPPETLNRMATVVNNLKPILTSADKKLKTAGDVGKFLEPAIAAASLLIEIIINSPLPPVFVTPPGPVLIGAFGPYGIINTERIATQARRNARVQWLQNAVETLTDEGRSIAITVSAAAGNLAPIKAKVDQIDALIQACYQNQELTDEERKLLLDSIQQSYSDPALNTVSYRSRSGRDYTIKVIKDPNSPDIAPKRQAIVQDFRGITVLTGPSSFASRPQILIEEIKFRIENQLP